MKAVFQQKVSEKESKLKSSEDEVCVASLITFLLLIQLYARHREMKEQLERQKRELEERKRRLENGQPGTPEKSRKNKGLFK